MSEWSLTPEYINRQWTEELLALMFRARNKRIRRQNESLEHPEDESKKYIPPEEFFKQMKVTPRKVSRKVN